VSAVGARWTAGHWRRDYARLTDDLVRQRRPEAGAAEEELAISPAREARVLKEHALGEQRVPETLRPILRQMGAALTAIANGDPEPLKALCSHGDEISQCGLWGGVERGWAEVGERFD